MWLFDNGGVETPRKMGDLKKPARCGWLGKAVDAHSDCAPLDFGIVHGIGSLGRGFDRCEANSAESPTERRTKKGCQISEEWKTQELEIDLSVPLPSAQGCFTNHIAQLSHLSITHPCIFPFTLPLGNPGSTRRISGTLLEETKETAFIQITRHN
jgi:hypothetical protein